MKITFKNVHKQRCNKIIHLQYTISLFMWGFTNGYNKTIYSTRYYISYIGTDKELKWQTSIAFQWHVKAINTVKWLGVLPTVLRLVLSFDHF